MMKIAEINGQSFTAVMPRNSGGLEIAVGAHPAGRTAVRPYGEWLTQEIGGWRGVIHTALEDEKEHP